MEEVRKSSPYVYFAAMLINVAPLISGVTVTWSSSAVSKLNGQKPDQNPLSAPATTTEISFIASLLAIGMMVGPPLTLIIDTIGRKRSLLIAVAAYALCFLVIAYAGSVWLFFLARFFFGALNGWVLAFTPNYLAEIAETRNRGNVNCLMKVSVCLGMLIMYCLGPYLSIFLSSMVYVIFLVLAVVVIVIFVPESPYYLVGKGDKAGAEAALVKLRGSKEVFKELEEIVVNVEESFKGKGNLLEIFKNSALLKCLLFALALMSFQQLTGSTPVLFYLQTIFESAGTKFSPEISSIIVGFVQFLSSFTSPLLVDKLGRRFLLLVSCSGTLVCLISLGTFFYLKHNNFPTEQINWLPIASLITFFLSYSMGIGPVPYTLISEIFPPDFKALACSLIVTWVGVGSFIASMSFPFMLDSIGTAASFWTFAGFSSVSLGFVYFCVPETKNKSFLEIQKMMRILKE